MLFRAFRALMPKEERFVDRFAAHADCMVATADALAAFMAASPADRPARFDEVSRLESEADVISRETVVALHRAFITPFDRSDIHALMTAMDDAVDLMEEVTHHAQLYKIEEFSPRMREFCTLFQKATRLLAEVMPLLNKISRNAERISALCEQVGKIEREADRLLTLALADLIAEKPDAVTFMGRKEVYELLETVTDRCDDVADIIQGIILDQV